MTTRTAVLLGASGLVGGHLLRLLATDPEYGAIRAFTRRPLNLTGTSVQSLLVDFDDPETYRRHLVGVDDVFCCLGTTIKIAGSQAAFRKVDFEAPVAVAREAVAAGAGQYLIVTAVGADSKSRVFYNRVKGEAEDVLRALAFPRGLKIFHPSFLIGERAQPRLGERAVTLVMRATRPLFAGGLARYRAIDALDVARALHVAATRDVGGVHVYEGETLFALAPSMG
jgi:uncharacterized protein YbjT (DUF2867 family)